MCFCVLQINLSMASNTHSSAVEEGELRGSPTMAQPVIPGLGPQPLIPGPRPRPLIPASSTQITIPAPTPEPAPEQYAGQIQRSFPPRHVRPPFLWGISEKILGQGGFGTVHLVQQTRVTDLKGRARSAPYHSASKFQNHLTNPTRKSSSPCPFGRSTRYSRGRVMRLNPMSWRRLTRV